MLLLSSLGILISLLITTAAVWVSLDDQAAVADKLSFLSIGAIAFFIGLLNVPSLIYSIRKLINAEKPARTPALFKAASLAMIGWAALVITGYFLNRSGITVNALIPITVLAIAIPVWWLIEFARRGLERPEPAKEWGAVTLGLTFTPIIIMLIEVLLVLVVAIIVLVILGLQPGTLDELLAITTSLGNSQGGLEQLDQLLFDLVLNPLVAAGIFLVIGIIAPFVEELFKPLSVWLHLHPPITSKDGYILGLISGGAFTLLESAGMIIQIEPQDWAVGILLRSATGLLHIGLSGLVGYGIGKARSEKRWGQAILYLLAAGGLHGLWNSMALLNGFSTTPLPTTGSSINIAIGGTITFISMLIIFMTVAFITVKLNKILHKEQYCNTIKMDNLQVPKI